ncbi:hypothetical protein CR513_46715, partial [Mucuna pruriens]
MVVTYKDWHDKLPYTLHEYRTSIRMSTGATSTRWWKYPLKGSWAKLNQVAEWVQTRLDQLNLIEEK